jgi:broad specificity phosphatase PhoE
MKHLIAITLTIILAVCSQAQEQVNTDSDSLSSYYFIRHAEKDRSDPGNKDPNLIQNGVFRAARWSYILEHVSFDAVYSTDYNRTRQTALPTAEKNNIGLTIYDSKNLNLDSFLASTKGQTVLIVGHSHSTPTFVNAVIGKQKYDPIDDSNNANLYIVTVSANGTITDTLLVID